MKIRTDFVTNSSSSSYVTVIFRKKSGRAIEFTSAIENNGFNNSLYFQSQDELDQLVKMTAGSGKMLIEKLDDLYEGSLLECIDCDRKNLEKILAVENFDELSEIVLKDDWGGDEGPSSEMTYRYDVNSGTSQKTEKENKYDDDDEEDEEYEEYEEESSYIPSDDTIITLVGIRLSATPRGKIYSFLCDIEDIKVGDRVLLENYGDQIYTVLSVDRKKVMDLDLPFDHYKWIDSKV